MQICRNVKDRPKSLGVLYDCKKLGSVRVREGDISGCFESMKSASSTRGEMSYKTTIYPIMLKKFRSPSWLRVRPSCMAFHSSG